MTIIDADKFVTYLIYSKHIDGLTCGEVKEAVEMCKVNVLDKLSALDKIRAEIKENRDDWIKGQDTEWNVYDRCLCIIDKYRGSEG